MRKAQQILELKKKKEQSANNKQEQKKQIEPLVKQEETEEEIVPKKNNMFAAFSDSSEQETRQQKQQQKEQVEEKEEEKPVKSKKKKNKKKKGKEQLNQEQQIDKILGQIREDNSNTIEKDQQEESSSKIFMINENKFNYENQLKKYFKNADEELPGGPNQQGLNKREKKYQKMMQNIKMKKSLLIPSTMNYFPIAEKFEYVDKEGILWIEASQKYEVLQQLYQSIKNSNDINEMFDFLQKNPYHTDALYNIGEFFRLKGNYKEADELIQRIIYIYEYSSQYNIGLFIKQNKPHKQIAYGRYSISLFMSILKFIDILGKKGCYRAGLQYCKLLLKLNLEDPSACLLTLDYNALSAKQYQYLIDFTHHFSKSKGKQFENKLLYWIPNFTYSFALSKFLLATDIVSKSIVEESEIDKYLIFTDKDVQEAMNITKIANYYQQSIQVLILRAILLYPKIFVQFAEKNDYSKQFLSHSSFKGYQKGNFKSIKEHKFFEQAPQNYFYTFLNIESEAHSKGFLKVMECYVTRSHILWKNNKVMIWIKAATGHLLNYIDSHQNFNYFSFQESLSIKSKLNQHIPEICLQLSKYQNVSKSNFMSNVERIDLNNIQDNQGFQAPQQPQNYNPVNVEENPFRTFFNTLLPWVHLPQGQNQEQDPDMPIIEEEHPN